MNVLDELIPGPQRQLLEQWRIRVRQIGRDIGRGGAKDPEVIALLHHLTRPTFFTRDDGFYDRALCHRHYCLVYLRVDETNVAAFMRMFLSHPAFSTYARRCGAVVRVGHVGIHFWRIGDPEEQFVNWRAS